MPGPSHKAAEGFARSKGLGVKDLQVREMDGGEYVVALVHERGRSANDVLSEGFPQPDRRAQVWKIDALEQYGRQLFAPDPVDCRTDRQPGNPADACRRASDGLTRGIRPYGSPDIALGSVKSYFDAMQKQGVILDPVERRAVIWEQVNVLAAEVGGTIREDPGLLEEVANLVSARPRCAARSRKNIWRCRAKCWSA